MVLELRTAESTLYAQAHSGSVFGLALGVFGSPSAKYDPLAVLSSGLHGHCGEQGLWMLNCRKIERFADSAKSTML